MSAAVRSGSVETAVEVAAALAAHALDEGRGVGLEAIGLNRAVVNVDRGSRQQHKIMGLLAVAQATGSTPLQELLLEGAARLRRGMIALVVTPSLDPSWVPSLATLRATGVAPIACLVDPVAHLRRRGRQHPAGRGRRRLDHGGRPGDAGPGPRPGRARRARLPRATRHPAGRAAHRRA